MQLETFQCNIATNNERVHESSSKYTNTETHTETTSKKRDTVRLSQIEFLLKWIRISWMWILQDCFSFITRCFRRSKKSKQGNKNEETISSLLVESPIVENQSSLVLDCKTIEVVETKVVTRISKSTSEISFHLESYRMSSSLKKFQKLEVCIYKPMIGYVSS